MQLNPFKLLSRGKVKSSDPQLELPPFAFQRFVPEDLRLSREELTSFSVVYAAIRAIVDPLAASDWAPVVENSGKRQALPDSNLHYILNVRADRDLPAMALKELLLTSALVNGNGYALIVRDQASRVIGVQPLDADRMQPRRGSDGNIVYVYRPENEDEVYLADTDVIHIRGPMSAFGLLGGSVVYQAVKAVSLAVAQERYALHYFQNGAHIGGYLKFATKPQDIERTKADWDAKNAGLGKSHGTAIVVNGEYVKVGDSAEQAQIIQSRQVSVHDVARYFGVPLTLLGEPQASQGYGTMTSQFFETFVKTCLGVWAKRVEQEVTYKLLAQRAPWPFVSVDLSWLLRGNEAERANAREVLIRSGQLTINEARSLEGRDSIEGGDTLIIGSGFQTFDSVINPPKPPEPTPADEDKEDPEENVENDDAKDGLEDSYLEKDKALNALLTSLLAKYQKRLPKDPADKFEVSVRAHEDLRNALIAAGEPTVRVQTALDSVAAGVDPAKAATHLLGR